MYVLPSDRVRERRVLDYVLRQGEFSDIDFVATDDPVALFDFVGFKGGRRHCQLDVKMLETSSTDYPGCFVSTDKYNAARTHLSYMLYAFKGDRVIMLFNLSACPAEYRPAQTIYHRRAHRKVTGPVYYVYTTGALATWMVPAPE